MELYFENDDIVFLSFIILFYILKQVHNKIPLSLDNKPSNWKF